MTLLRMLAIVALILTSACERSYGIHRSAVVDEIPDGACIRRILDTTPGITSVHEWGVSIRKDSRPGDAHGFDYEGPRVEGTLQLGVGEASAIQISQYRMRENQKPPQHEIDATRAVMIEVERRLEAECGVKGLTSKVKEVCLRVKCGEDK